MREVTRRGEPTVRQAIIGEFSPWVIRLIILGAVLTVIGAWDGVYDAGGDRNLGSIPLVFPAVVAGFAALELIWRQSEVPIQGRIVYATLIAPLPSALFSTVVWTVAGLLGSRVIARTAVGHYEHYYWPPDAQSPKAGVLMLFGSYSVAASIGLGVLLIVTLPAAAFLRSREVFAGTDLSDEPHHLAANVWAMRLAFVALSSAMIAAIFWGFEISVAWTVVFGLVTILLFAGAAVLAVRRH